MGVAGSVNVKTTCSPMVGVAGAAAFASAGVAVRCVTETGVVAPYVRCAGVAGSLSQFTPAPGWPS